MGINLIERMDHVGTFCLNFSSLIQNLNHVHTSMNATNFSTGEYIATLQHYRYNNDTGFKVEYDIYYFNSVPYIIPIHAKHHYFK